MTKRKLHFDSWKIFRIVSEFVEGFETMSDIGPSVSIFGSARVDPEHPYYTLSTNLAKKIADKGFGIITGGGPGLMAAANKGAQEANGRSCGVSIDLPYEEASNPYIDRKYLMHLRYFFIRKVMFIRYAQACIFLPGGFGTLDELFETLTLIQTNKITPFPIFLIGESYWSGMIQWLKSSALKEKFISPSDFDLFTITDDPDLVVKKIEEHHKQRGEGLTFELGPQDES